MPIYRRNFRELSPERRREGAKLVRDRIMGALRSPGLDPAQTVLLQRQLQQIDIWEMGGSAALPEGAAPGVQTDGASWLSGAVAKATQQKQ